MGGLINPVLKKSVDTGCFQGDGRYHDVQRDLRRDSIFSTAPLTASALIGFLPGEHIYLKLHTTLK